MRNTCNPIANTGAQYHPFFGNTENLLYKRCRDIQVIGYDRTTPTDRPKHDINETTTTQKKNKESPPHRKKIESIFWHI